jgi:DNA invertase Pin-like site-specific DNA recombinase
VTVADAYLRKSSKDDGRSVESQEDEWREDCGDQGLEPGRIFADPDKSASRYTKKRRPDYEALVEHVSAGACRLLWMWEASRGDRRAGRWLDFLDLCREHGTLIRVKEHGRTYDPRIRRDWKSLADEGVNSDNESQLLSERIQRGKNRAAKVGRPCARLAYGFKRVYDERGNWVEQVEHPEQAPIVRQIIERIADGEAIYAIAQDLNDRQVTAPLGGQWTQQQVRQIAVKASYAGKRVHRGAIVGDGLWEPIVDPQVWQTAYDLLADPSRRRHQDGRMIHWLASAVTCGLCKAGTLMSVPRHNSGPAYICRACLRVSASARGLEGAVEPLILGRLRRGDAAQLFVPRNDDGALQAAMAEEKRLRSHLAGFVKRAANPDSGITPDTLDDLESEMRPKIDAATLKVKRLSTPPALAKLAGVDVVGRWGDLEARVRRDVVVAIAEIQLDPPLAAIGPRFDRRRLGNSRWVGDPVTWGQYWAAESAS